jgi:hypothetical protein
MSTTVVVLSGLYSNIKILHTFGHIRGSYIVENVIKCVLDYINTGDFVYVRHRSQSEACICEINNNINVNPLSSHGSCMSAFLCVVLSCVYRGLSIRLSSVQQVLPNT